MQITNVCFLLDIFDLKDFSVNNFYPLTSSFLSFEGLTKLANFLSGWNLESDLHPNITQCLFVILKFEVFNFLVWKCEILSFRHFTLRSAWLSTQQSVALQSADVYEGSKCRGWDFHGSSFSFPKNQEYSQKINPIFYFRTQCIKLNKFYLKHGLVGNNWY